MRTTIYGLLFLSACMSAGCLHLPQLMGDGKPSEAPAQPAARPSRPRPPVTADQVNETNAHEMAAALRDEVDREFGEKE